MNTYYIGLDFGGTNLKAGLVCRENGAVSQITAIPTMSHEGPPGVMERMAWLINGILTGSPVSKHAIGGVGIGVPGIVNREANTVGSKSVSSDLSRISMDLKVLIEQMREQVQNIE